MLRSTQLIVTTLVLLVFSTGQVDAQRRCPDCKKTHAKKTHAANRHRAPKRLQTARQAQQEREQRVQRAQHTSPVPATQLPPSPPRLSVAQNPLDELQNELNDATEQSADDLLDDLEDISDALDSDTRDSELPSQRDVDALDDIFSGRDALQEPNLPEDRDAARSQRNPLSALDDQERESAADESAADESDADESDADESDATEPRRNAGLQDDEYYRSLGAPKTAPRQDRSSQPLTMGNIFGPEDEYDCDCQREYCRRMWACAGGRNQGFMRRGFRDWERDRLVRNGNSCQLWKNDHKCPKVQNDPNATARPSTGRPCGPEGAYDAGIGGQYIEGGEYYEVDGYSDGAGREELLPSPAEIPMPMVDEP